MRIRLLSIGLLTVLTAAFLAPEVTAEDGAQGMLVYVGTYTRVKSKGIYAYRLNSDTGAMVPIGLVAETRNPSFLVIPAGGRFLYAVSETEGSDGRPGGAVSAYAIDAGTGALKFVNQQPSGGAGPCHLALDRDARHLFVANYGGGSISAFPLSDDGSIQPSTAFVQHQGSSVDPGRQKGPHAHGVYLDPSNRHLIVADLGLDQLLVYRFENQKGTLTPHEPAFAPVKPGAGPRHFTFSTDGRHGFVINELNSTVTAFSYDASAGKFAEIETVSSLPAGWTGRNSTAEIYVHPSLPVLYGSNRGHDSIHMWKIDPQSGRLTSLGTQSTQGRTPRHFAIDPSGRYLLAAHQDSDSIVVFKIDSQTGLLSPTGNVVEVGSPVCVAFVRQ